MTSPKAFITAFLNQKGGVGKTTLSWNYACALAKAGHKVLLVDADPQGGSLTRQNHREAPTLFPVIGLATDKIHRELAAHAGNYDHIVIDPPPQASGIARSIIVSCNLILIPVQPSPDDIWSAATIVDLIEEAAPFNENLKTAFVVNRKITNTVLGRDVFLALENYPFPVLPTAIHQRVTFPESAMLGSSVFETDPQGAASQEMFSLIKDISDFMTAEEKPSVKTKRKAG